MDTHTFLFSDIEGSTRLLARLGPAYAAVLATHRAIVRRAVAAHDGMEHMTRGDGFLVIFPAPQDALAAAIEAQLGLRAHPWPDGVTVRVRMGLHVGEIGWADDDVVGIAVHEAARIADAAHGGQVLLSPIVREQVAQACPAGVTLRSLGRHILKDFPDPIELFQACHPALPGDFPPARSAVAVRDLPVSRTSFVGRQREVDQVLKLLAAGRHVTLTGVGGSGKTRLAVEVALRDADRHPDGVFFVDLAPVADPELVLGAVSAGVNMHGMGADLRTILLSYLSKRRSLIVLDNCEHLIDACAGVVDMVLENCPSIRILATSREALQIEGEQTFQVPSLSLAEDGSEAVQLFVSRARAIKPDFDVTDANRDDVMAICRRLDGIPLAIELAAGRMGHLVVGDIARRLDDRFALLVGGRRRAQRQQTLQAAMDWSWALLSDDERVLLRRLAVFAGPFSLEAAEAVCGGRTLDLLGSLVLKSLVTMDDHADTTRYRLLETVRLHAQERLVEAGEAAERRDAHRDWYLSRTEGVPYDNLFDWRVAGQFFADYGNHRAALDWSASQDRPDLVARQVLHTAAMWADAPALFEEGRRWCRLIGEDQRLPAADRAAAYAVLAHAALLCGDYASIREFGERSLEIDDRDQPSYGIVLWALVRYDEAAEVALRSGLPTLARISRATKACLRIYTDPADALRRLEEVIAELDPGSPGWAHFFALTGSTLARLALDDGRGALEDTRALREALRGVESWGGSFVQYPSIFEAMALGQLGRFEEARAALHAVAKAVLRDRYPILAHDCLAALAYIACQQGDVARAATLLEPVVADGRLRIPPMYAFVGRFLGEVHQQVTGPATDPPLPDPRAFGARANGILSGDVTPDPAAVVRIEATLSAYA